ncbi:MAG: TM2 domain-containing protein [Firmicutes bacterium]|nr:TM2 domain-containing protein [Bacillota bacterium]
MYCSNCGKEIDDKAAICIHCGVPTNHYKNVNTQDMTLKSKLAAGLLAIFVGSLGIHNFYLGYTTKAWVQLLLTVVGWVIIVGPIISGIWALIEGIMILTGSIAEDGEGKPLRD